MTARSRSGARAFYHTKDDEYSEDSWVGADNSTTTGASGSAKSSSGGNSNQRDDDSHYFFTSSSPPPPPPPPQPRTAALGKKQAVSEDQSSNDATASDDYAEIDQRIQTLARPLAKKEKPRIEPDGDSAATSCLGFQMELRACLDANDNRESVCMWHFRTWQKCKTEQQELATDKKYGGFGM